VGYDEAGELLEIKFKNGGIYQYSAVPSSIFADFTNASSKGLDIRLTLPDIEHTFAHDISCS
jgi:hypothetical protein